jgi:hypothetical protein
MPTVRFHVATRKGLFTVDRNSAGGWAITRVSFLGDNCTLVMHDPRDGSLLAALNHGHFGNKMHRHLPIDRQRNDVRRNHRLV